jgi:ATP-dependent RNA helicase DDX41
MSLTYQLLRDEKRSLPSYLPGALRPLVIVSGKRGVWRRSERTRSKKRRGGEKKCGGVEHYLWRRRKSTPRRHLRVCNHLLHLTGILRRKSADAQKTEAEKAEEADAQILAAIASRKKLASDRELAKGIEYTEALRTSWVANRNNSRS